MRELPHPRLCRKETEGHHKPDLEVAHRLVSRLEGVSEVAV